MTRHHADDRCSHGLPREWVYLPSAAVSLGPRSSQLSLFRGRFRSHLQFCTASYNQGVPQGVAFFDSSVFANVKQLIPQVVKSTSFTLKKS
eukprot:scaffold12_cov368-Pavlova_lutheri.AAC.7